MSALSRPYFHCDEAAFAHLESVVWANGVTCPHCGSMSGKHYDLRKTRVGLRKCSDCRKQFTAKVGTVFESAHIPLHKMLQAVYLLCSSKKGISAHQLHRVLGITYKSAWFLCHRIREAMRSGDLSPLGSGGGTVEIDETVYGRMKGAPKKLRGGRNGLRNVALTLVERGGRARSFHVTGTTIAELKPIIHANVAREAAMMTDQASWYPEIGKEFASHDTVNHAKEEYIRYEGRKMVGTNTVEGFYSIFKRGMKGVYQHCSEKHLHRYLAEFDFRYNNRTALGVDDSERTGNALKGISGKRLTYRRIDEPTHPQKGI
jgi:transposase-like protein